MYIWVMSLYTTTTFSSSEMFSYNTIVDFCACSFVIGVISTGCYRLQQSNNLHLNYIYFLLTKSH